MAERLQDGGFTVLGLAPWVAVVLVSLSWMAASSSIILINKDLLSHGFPYPVRPRPRSWAGGRPCSCLPGRPTGVTATPNRSFLDGCCPALTCCPRTPQMALSGMGMGFSALASYACCHVFHVVEPRKRVTPLFFLTNILPVGFCMALCLHFGNQAYLYLTVAFVQMLKVRECVSCST